MLSILLGQDTLLAGLADSSLNVSFDLSHDDLSKVMRMLRWPSLCVSSSWAMKTGEIYMLSLNSEMVKENNLHSF